MDWKKRLHQNVRVGGPASSFLHHDSLTAMRETNFVSAGDTNLKIISEMLEYKASSALHPSEVLRQPLLFMGLTSIFGNVVCAHRVQKKWKRLPAINSLLSAVNEYRILSSK